MNSHHTHEHWFSFGDCCLAVSETIPLKTTKHNEGHCLFFLHGRFGHAEIWRPLVERLGAQFRCLRIDLPGFGRSFSASGRGLTLLEQVGLVEALLKHFSSGSQPVIIGHDVGGAIAQLSMLQVPGLVAAMVLINSCSVTQGPRHLNAGIFSWRARQSLHGLFRALGDFGLASEHRVLLSESWRDRARRESMARAFRAWHYSWPGPMEQQLWRRELGRLSQPVLVLWGRQDPLHPPENADELMRQFHDAHLFETEDCGHWPCLEQVEWVHTKLREFLFQLGGLQVQRRVASR